jgi:WD40 repeat protein
LDDYEFVDAYLAGHEKRIDWLSFHPRSNNILTTSSIDGTIRLWDIQKLQDRIVLDLPDSVTAPSCSFDVTLNALCAACSDGNLRWFDPRAKKEPTMTNAMELSVTKGFHVAIPHSKSLLFTIGFNNQGQREMRD